METTMSVEALTETIRERIERADALEAQAREIIARLADTTDPEARALILAERAALRNEREALGEEVALLQARRNTLQIDAARQRLELATQEYAAANKAAAAQRREMNSVLEARRRAYMGHPVAPDDADAVKEWQKLETQLLEAKAHGFEATARQATAGRELQAAQAALAELEDQ